MKVSKPYTSFLIWWGVELKIEKSKTFLFLYFSGKDHSDYATVASHVEGLTARHAFLPTGTSAWEANAAAVSKKKSLEANNTEAIWRKPCYDWKLKRLKGRQNVIQCSACFQIAVMTVLERKPVSGAWRMGTTVKRLTWSMTVRRHVDIVVSANSFNNIFQPKRFHEMQRNKEKVALI